MPLAIPFYGLLAASEQPAYGTRDLPHDITCTLREISDGLTSPLTEGETNDDRYRTGANGRYDRAACDSGCPSRRDPRSRYSGGGRRCCQAGIQTSRVCVASRIAPHVRVQIPHWQRVLRQEPPDARVVVPRPQVIQVRSAVPLFPREQPRRWARPRRVLPADGPDYVVTEGHRGRTGCSVDKLFRRTQPVVQKVRLRAAAVRRGDQIEAVYVAVRPVLEHHRQAAPYLPLVVRRHSTRRAAHSQPVAIIRVRGRAAAGETSEACPRGQLSPSPLLAC